MILHNTDDSWREDGLKHYFGSAEAIRTFIKTNFTDSNDAIAIFDYIMKYQKKQNKCNEEVTLQKQEKNFYFYLLSGYFFPYNFIAPIIRRKPAKYKELEAAIEKLPWYEFDDFVYELAEWIWCLYYGDQSLAISKLIEISATVDKELEAFFNENDELEKKGL